MTASRLVTVVMDLVMTFAAAVVAVSDAERGLGGDFGDSAEILSKLVRSSGRRLTPAILSMLSKFFPKFPAGHAGIDVDG